MNLPSSYRVAAVTGGTRGIGLAAARGLRAAGLEVHLIARGSPDADALAGEGYHVHRLDIAETSALAACLGQISPDVLINNAGHVHRGVPLQELDANEIDSLVAVNLLAPLHALRACLPIMIERGRGHIINLGSTAAEGPFPGMALYGAVKAAIHELGPRLRYDLAGTGVRVTTISPGRVDTGIHAQAAGVTREEIARRLYDGLRVLHADDIADAILFALAAPEHVDVSFMSVLPTDQALGGGRFERPPPSA